MRIDAGQPASCTIHQVKQFAAQWKEYVVTLEIQVPPSLALSQTTTLLNHASLNSRCWNELLCENVCCCMCVPVCANVCVYIYIYTVCIYIICMCAGAKRSVWKGSRRREEIKAESRAD